MVRGELRWCRLEDTLELPSIECRLVLADLYEKADLAPASPLGS